MQKLLFMFFAVGCIYNIQAERSQVVELEPTTEQVEANETSVDKKNKRSNLLGRFNSICPEYADCKAFLKFEEMKKKQF